MCGPAAPYVAAVAAGLFVKQQADAQAANMENAYKRQLEESKRQAAEQQKSFEDQLANEAINPTLVNKSGQGATDRDSLRVKPRASNLQDKSVGGLGSSTGVNIATV